MVLHHPTTAPSRHAVYHRMVARNRVWLARRNLPAPLVPVYLGVWTALTLARVHAARRCGPGSGASPRAGAPTPARGGRCVATVWRMTRLGRPPVI